MNWCCFAILCVLCGICSTQETRETRDILQKTQRDPRWFFFIILPYALHQKQNTTSGTCVSTIGVEGTCMTRPKCKSAGGAPYGSCGNSTKVICCAFVTTCGDTAATGVTYFINPGYPSTYSDGGTCELLVSKLNSNICQLKLEFLNLTLAQPDSTGECTSDFLTISTSDSPPLCGENTNQHVYVDFDVNDSSKKVIIGTDADTTFNRTWSVKITQISCNSTERAPQGCLQFYNNTSGAVSSFNYGTEALTTGNWTRQLNHLHYGACVRRAVGYCAIEWSAASGSNYTFTVSANTTAVTPGNSSTAFTGVNCTHNYIIIPNTTPTGDRFCGNAFLTISTVVKPFVLFVVTNYTNGVDSGNRGFKLNYRQLPCMRCYNCITF